MSIVPKLKNPDLKDQLIHQKLFFKSESRAPCHTSYFLIHQNLISPLPQREATRLCSSFSISLFHGISWLALSTHAGSGWKIVYKISNFSSILLVRPPCTLESWDFKALKVFLHLQQLDSQKTMSIRYIFNRKTNLEISYIWKMLKWK